jgi:hypothetical protein
MWPFRNKESSQAKDERKGQNAIPMALVCPHCGQKYLVGVDSIVVTKDAVRAGLHEMGATVLTRDGNIVCGPDLMMYVGNLDLEVKKKNLYRVAQIKTDVSHGVPRSWRCSKCQTGDSSPIAYLGR